MKHITNIDDVVFRGVVIERKVKLSDPKTNRKADYTLRINLDNVPLNYVVQKATLSIAIDWQNSIRHKPDWPESDTIEIMVSEKGKRRGKTPAEKLADFVRKHGISPEEALQILQGLQGEAK